MGITTVEALREYLEAANFEISNIEQLQGGYTNYVWRVDEKSGRTFAVKHAEPQARFNVDFEIPTTRMDFEARALRTIRLLLHPDAMIHVPEVHSYDADEHILMMDYGGPRTLKVAYTDESVDMAPLGTHIGAW